MVKNTITAAHWNTASLNFYHQPWTTDKQNRFFSLQAWGPGTDKPAFTAKFIGRPVNVAFKSKHKASGKEEPCLCILFAESVANPNGVARLVQASNFVIVDAFPGYDPIDHSLIKKYKLKKDLMNGAWYKKVWNTYCTAEAPAEYKQPEQEGPVTEALHPSKKNTEIDPTQKSLQQMFGKRASETAFSGDDDEGVDAGVEGDDEEEVDIGGVTTDSTVDNGISKSPHPEHLKTYNECHTYFWEKRIKREQTKKNDAKEKRRLEYLKNMARAENPDWDSDNADFSDVSDASEFVCDSEVEDEVTAQAKQTWDIFKPKAPPLGKSTPPKRTTSSGSVSSSSGII